VADALPATATVISPGNTRNDGLRNAGLREKISLKSGLFPATIPVRFCE
jgi:hypothetical protein